MKPYDSPSGTVWDFQGEFFVMLDEFMHPAMLLNGYRRYLSLETGELCWMGNNSERDGLSEPVA